jgi:hypothetical protein
MTQRRLRTICLQAAKSHLAECIFESKRSGESQLPTTLTTNLSDRTLLS